MRLRVLCTVLFALTTGCAASNVAYHPPGLPGPPARTVRLFIDREGDLYPSIGVDTEQLRRSWTLLDQYYRNAQQGRAAEWTTLLGTYGVADGSFDPVWQTVQDSIVAVSVRNAVAAAGDGPLVVLIHGYNNSASEAFTAFDSVHAGIQRRRARYGDPGFLEVYWDGLTDGGDKLRNPSAWGGGQHNAYLVGLTLRRILNGLPHQMPLRILTHSHGGKVASVSLWHVTSSIDPGASAAWRVRYDTRRHDRARYSIPTLTDVRLAMLVPAMPGNVLGDYSRPDSTPPASVRRVIVGRNSRDMAVSKNVFNTPVTRWLGINSASHGSTTLGARPGEFERFASSFNHSGQPEVAFCVDFSGTQVRPREHAWTTYMQREAVESVLDLLFLDGVTNAHRCQNST